MRIEHPWLAAAAGAIVLQIVALGASPYAIAPPWDALWHFLAYSALTLLLWIATGGRRPFALTGAVLLLGAWSGDLAAAAPAAVLTAGALALLQGKPRCVESSPR